MKNLPWKKIGKGVLRGLAIASAVDPIHFAPVAPLVELIEDLMPDAAGVEKKAAFMKALESSIALLPADKQDEARALYSSLADAYVAARNAEAKFHASHDALVAFIDAVKGNDAPQ